MRRPLGPALVIALACVAVFAQQAHPPGPHRHPEAQALKNPVASDDPSVEEGQKTYRRFCQGCHGRTGEGDGGMAVGGGTPANLTDDTWDHGSSDGEIFTVVRDGLSADMEGYGDRLTDTQVWQLVNYIKTLAPKKAE